MPLRPNIARKLANLDSNRFHMDRMLSAQQIRAGRGLLGWSRRDLAFVSGISQGTIKAIEKGTTDARLSTLRKLVQTFTAHGVEFVSTGPLTGAVIKARAEVGRTRPTRIAPQSGSTTSQGSAEVAEGNGDIVSATWPGLQWLRTRKG